MSTPEERARMIVEEDNWDDDEQAYLDAIGVGKGNGDSAWYAVILAVIIFIIVAAGLLKDVLPD